MIVVTDEMVRAFRDAYYRHQMEPGDTPFRKGLEAALLGRGEAEPVAHIVERLDGSHRKVLLVEGYDPRRPEFWLDDKARRKHRVTPLYATPDGLSNRWPDPLDSPQAEAIRNGKIDNTEITSLFDKMERELIHLREIAARSATPPAQAVAITAGWSVRGAEAYRLFPSEDEAREFAGTWGLVKPVYDAPTAQAAAITEDALAEAIWLAIRGAEDRCDMEYDEMSRDHAHFVAARVALSLIAATPPDLAERVRDLEEALRPFAAVCTDVFNSHCPDDTPAWEWEEDDEWCYSPVTVGDFRRAAQAMEPDKS